MSIHTLLENMIKTHPISKTSMRSSMVILRPILSHKAPMKRARRAAPMDEAEQIQPKSSEVMGKSSLPSMRSSLIWEGQPRTMPVEKLARDAGGKYNNIIKSFQIFQFLYIRIKYFILNYRIGVGKFMENKEFSLCSGHFGFLYSLQNLNVCIYKIMYNSIR